MIRLLLPETIQPVMVQKWLAPNNEEYRLTIAWNPRAGWFLGMDDRAGDVIFAPRAMLVNRDLLKPVRDSRKPNGALLLYAADESRECSFDDLGTRCQLYYLTSEELE